MSERRRVLAIQVVTVAVVLAAYEALAHSHLLYEGVVPPLSEIGAALVASLGNVTTYANLGVTTAEVLAGFAAGSLAGIALGMWAGARSSVAAAIGPYLDGIATAPKIVFFPIALLLFGVGPASKSALGALSAFFPVAITMAAAVRRINPVFVRVGRSFRCSPRQMALLIYLPALVPAVVNGMRIGLGVTVIAVLLGEIKLSDRGIGFETIDAYNHFRIPQMYALLVVIFTIAVVANAALARITSKEPT